jgi:carboxymethylenebutenolidase
MNKVLVGFLAIALIGIVAAAGGLHMFNQELLTPKEENVFITSGGQAYPAYFEQPHATGDVFPAVVLIHSFNGLEQGYKDMMEKMAEEGFAIIAPEWQTFTQTPTDEVMQQLIADAVAFLKNQTYIDPARIGLTGFCAGGRYTILFLPQMAEFRSGVAFYGFPYSGGFANQSLPVDYVTQLSKPMLMIHGSRDQASNIQDIDRYATALDAAGKYFELKVYQGEPHGFMVQNGTLNQSFPAKDAYREMVSFFQRTLT